MLWIALGSIFVVSSSTGRMVLVGPPLDRGMLVVGITLIIFGLATAVQKRRTRNKSSLSGDAVAL